MSRKLGKLLRPNMWIYLTVMLGFCVVSALRRHYLLAIAELCVTAVLLALFLLFQNIRRKRIRRFLEHTLDETKLTDGLNPPFPMLAFRMEDNGIVYANDAFWHMTGLNDVMAEQSVEDIMPQFKTDWLLAGQTEYPYDVSLGARRYRVYGTVVRTEDAYTSRLGVLFFADLTQMYQIRDEYIRSRPVVAVIMVDNYEELTKNLSEGAISSLNARINEAITTWSEDYNALLRKLERNRFLMIFEKRDMKRAVEDKFSLIDEIHAITGPSGLAASLSVGVGVDGENYSEAYDFAALAIEMALSRGGDQAVVKDRLNFTFYGGRTKETDHRSKVRSRVTANSLMELIGQSSHVFIMGHKNADMDAVGAAAGIYCLCRKKGKNAHIVLDMQETVAQKLVEELCAAPQYKNAFISAQDAILLSDNRSTLVVVDTNRPDQVENKSLLETIPRVCVVDHHRRAADYITPVVVNFHEPYASSASELVTELLQYAAEKKDILPVEAKALMAGIFLDTKSFQIRTGERTFEAAAYLRQLGADTVEVKKLLQNDFRGTMEKYQIIRAAKLYRQEIAIAALNTAPPRTLAAQAADELLNISGINTSFVLYPDGDQVIISARSIGRANVQVILEPLGGGGNTATAGAQITGSTVNQVLDRLVASIDRFYDE